MTSSHTYAAKWPVHLSVKGNVLSGDLCIPRNAKSIVILPGSTESARESHHLTRIASTLQKAGIGTLLADLLTDEERAFYKDESHRAPERLPMELAERLMSFIHQLWAHEQAAGLPIDLFAANEMADPALTIAVRLNQEIQAMVVQLSADDAITHRDLHMVKAPTLVIASGSSNDRYNDVLSHLRCEKKLEVIPGKARNVEDEAAEAVASLATCWYRDHLPTGPSHQPV